MASSDNIGNETISNNETLQELNFRYTQALIPFLVLNGIICVVGLVGNILIIVVFSIGKDYRKTNFKVFVLGLASIDLLACLTIIPMELFKARRYYDYPNNLLCKSKCALQLFSMTAAALTLLVICIDRYRITCKQFQCQIRQKLAKCIIFAVIVVSIVLSIPAGILCGTTENMKANKQGYNITIYLCQTDERYKSSIFRKLYKYFMSTVLTGVSIAFIVLYILILRYIYRHWKRPGLGGSIRMDDLVGSVSTASSTIHSVPDQQSGSDDVFSLSVSENNVNGSRNSNRKTSRQDSHQKPAHSSNRSLQTRTSGSSIKSNSLGWVGRHRRSSTPPGRISPKTVLWFVLTLIFLVTYITYASLSFVSQSLLNTLSPWVMLVYQLFSRLHYMNNSINVFVYAILDRKFLPHCKTLFKRQKSNR